MSGRVATPIARVCLVLALAAGAGAPGGAQDPPRDPDGAGRDDRSPRPPGDDGRPVAALKYQIPNKDRAIFQGYRNAETGRQKGGIVDFAPVASEAENKQEYDAWHEVTAHAAQFTSAELEGHAGRDATREELVGPPRDHFRLELLRFDGRLTKARRLAAAKSLAESGVAESYEALLVPLGGPPNRPVSVVFTELPPELAELRQAPEARWSAVDRWGTAAGYFFKAVQDAPGADPLPLLVGKSVRVLAEEPPGPDPKNPAAVDKGLRVFRHVRNDAPVASGDENFEEMVAWNRVLLHARRFPPEELERHARTDLTFADLFFDGRWVDKDGKTRFDGARDYKLDLVKFEGRLIQLKRMKPSAELRDAGVEEAYQGWLLPRDEPGGNLVCVVFTDPLEGVEPTGRVNRWVSFAGYAFKLMRYESGEKEKDDPTRYVWKRAPLLLGRAATPRPDPESASPVSWESFATAATAVVLGLVGSALALAWWYRGGDRAARRAVAANRERNPFGEP
jgi:hypothetical protein